MGMATNEMLPDVSDARSLDHSDEPAHCPEPSYDCVSSVSINRANGNKVEESVLPVGSWMVIRDFNAGQCGGGCKRLLYRNEARIQFGC